MRISKNIPFYIILFFVVCQIGFAIKMMLTVSQLEELLQPSTRLEHNWNVRMHLQNIKTNMQDAELSIYRYVLLKSDEFLLNLRRLEESREAEFRALEILQEKEGAKDVILNELRSISGQQMRRFSDVISSDQYRTNQTHNLVQFSSTLDIKQLQENTTMLHDLISAMDKEQEALIIAKQDDLKMVYQSSIVTYVLASITFAILLFLLYRFHRKNTKRDDGPDTVRDVVSKHLLRSGALPRHLLEIAEQEKANLARELHDELGSHLMVINMNLTIALEKFGPSNPELASHLEETLELLKKTVDIKCHIIENLRPSMLEDFGLVASIHAYCEDIARRSGLKIDVKIDENFDQIQPAQSIALYRIVQESLTNTVKYANATCASISLRQTSDGIRLCIFDDGVGIAHDVLKKPRSHGILGMRERAILNGGSFSISRGRENRGTRIEVFIPYNEE